MGHGSASPFRRAAIALALGLVSVLEVLYVTSGPIAVGVDSILWRRFAGGGRLREAVTVPLPALRRLDGGRLAIDARAPTAADRPVAVSVDGDPPSRVALSPGSRVWLALPTRERDGADVVLRPEGRAAVDGLVVAVGPETGRAVVAGVTIALVALLLLRTRPMAEALGLALFAAGGVGLGCIPGWILLGWPGGGTVWRLAVPLLAATAGLALALGRAGHRRSSVARLALLMAAGLFGCGVRAFFLPSAGSWDVDYWRTAMLEATAHGLGHAYGGPADVPEGHFLAQLRGRERVSAPQVLGRPIVVNYPPLAVSLWTASWRLAESRAVRLETIEAQALATKLPPLAGDLAAVALLLWIHRARPWRAATLAAVYWATPVSWINSAVQGYQDGAYAPLVVLALAAASGGHGFWAGAALGVAAMIKLPALLVAPAVAGALIASVPAGPAARRLATAALGGLLTSTAAFLPFARAGTLPAALVHVNSIWLPGPASGGSPNLWWLAGQALAIARRGASVLDRVTFVPHDVLPVPAYAIGRVLWASSAVAIVWLQRRRPGLRPAALAAATLVFTYAMLATGVYENHIHPLFLLLLAGGLVTRRGRLVAAAAAVVYVLDVLAMSGLGRFYTMRYALLLPLAPVWDELRMGLGFDLTVALAVVNLGLLVAWWTGLPAALRTPMDAPDPAYRRPQAVA